MKKPESKTETKSAGKKPPAKSPVIDGKAVDAGQAASAAAKGGAVKPADSALVGKSDSKVTAAAKKPQPEVPLRLTEPAEAAKAKADDAATESRLPKQGAAKPGASSPIEAATAKARTGAAKDAPPKPADSAEPDTPRPQTAPAQKVTVKKTGFWPTVLGGVVAAGLGSAATIYALPHLPAGWLPDSDAPVVDTEALKADTIAAAEQALQAQTDGLKASATEAGAQAGADAARQVIADLPTADSGAATAVQATLAAQADKIAALENRLTAPVAGDIPPPPVPVDGAAQAAPTASGDQIAALSAQLQQQAAQIAELQARPVIDPETVAKVQTLATEAEALQGQIKAAAEQAQSQITAAQAEAAKLQEAAAASTKRAEALAAVAALQTALDQGVATDDAVAQLKEAGVQPPEAVTADVPTLGALQDSFDDAARAALRAALKDQSADQGAGSLIGNFLRAQTGARSVAPRDGTDPDAVLSRADAGVKSGDIATALTEVETLPPVARDVPAMADWIAGAQSYQAARAAVTELSGQSN